jgi:hypothetical protein
MERRVAALGARRSALGNGDYFFFPWTLLA